MIGTMLDNIKEKRPMVHCITNYVTANDCANILLALGASPIMADDPNEAAQITGLCSALVLNMGTPDERKLEAMIISGKTANEKGIPVILDPVGVGSSDFRMKAAGLILENIKLSVIRANAGEIKSLLEHSYSNRGVDNDDAESADHSDAAKLAQKLSSVVVLTGKNDIVTDGKTAYCVKNGDPMMRYVTGSGCQLSALMGGFAAANKENMLLSSLAAVCMMGLCGEKAKEQLQKYEGSAALRTRMIDNVFWLNSKDLLAGGKYEKII